jgi:hypothetical protein
VNGLCGPSGARARKRHPLSIATYSRLAHLPRTADASPSADHLLRRISATRLASHLATTHGHTTRYTHSLSCNWRLCQCPCLNLYDRYHRWDTPASNGSARWVRRRLLESVCYGRISRERKTFSGQNSSSSSQRCSAWGTACRMLWSLSSSSKL